MEWANKRAREVVSFYRHLIAYVAVCTGLVVLDLLTGGEARFLGLDWAFWPVGGWAIGVAAHGLSLLYNPKGGGWEGRKASQLYQKRLRSMGAGA